MSRNTTTTLDQARGLLVRVFPENEGIYVRDIIGLRYGYGKTLLEAVAMWAHCVQDVCDEANAGGALLHEQKAYREALEMDE